jgi:hypothetical protein
LDAPLLANNETSEIIDDKECCLDILYDNALDDGPMLLITLHVYIRNKMIYLLSMMMLSFMSPMLFFKSPTYTIEEKYAYVEKYLCGLQISYENFYCNHDFMITNYIGNYFERGNHVNEFLNKFNDPLYVPKNFQVT